MSSFIVTKCDTQWNDDNGKLFVIPKGTRGTILTKSEIGRLPPSVSGPIRSAREKYKQRGMEGVFVLLRGKYRFVEKADLDFI